MFGTKKKSPKELRIEKIYNLLNRETEIDILDTLLSSMGTKQKNIDLNSTAFGLDANVLLKLARHQKSTDILDYLNGKHKNIFIIPSQIIQEFWNNQLTGIKTVSTSIKEKFDQLNAELKKLDSRFDAMSGNAQAFFSELSEDYGYLYDEGTIKKTIITLEALKQKAYVACIPRLYFHEIERNRKLSKTPPGFKDDGSGDFYVWAELLYGLLHNIDMGAKFEHVVLLTSDKKIDWSRAGGIAHPILSAEMKKITNASFDVWTIEEMAKAIDSENKD